MTYRRASIAVFVLIALQGSLWAQGAVIDLGWLRASQTPEGWRVEQVSMLSATGERLQQGDAVYSVDGRRIDNLNALSASNELDWISRGAYYARVLRNGSPHVVHLRGLSSALHEGFQLTFRRDGHAYSRDDRITALRIPDQSGGTQTVELGPGTTLIHVWSPI